LSGGRWTRSPLNECIEVSPVYFFDGQKGSSNSSSSEVVVGSNDDNDNDEGLHSSPIAAMAVHFWSCDDRYNQRRDDNFLPKSDRRGERHNRSYPQFTTCNNQRCGGHVTICTFKQYTNKTKHTVRMPNRSHPQFTIYNNQRCGGHVEEYDIHRGGRRRLLGT